MSRISAETLIRAIQKVSAMTLAQKEALADEIYRQQPILLSSVLVLQRKNVTMQKLDFLFEMLFICFQAMKESKLTWPMISEEEYERQLARHVAIVKFADAQSPAHGDQLRQEYTQQHPEQYLLAYVITETTKWLQRIAPEESDTQLMLAAICFVNCIAHVPMGSTPANSNKGRLH